MTAMAVHSDHAQQSIDLGVLGAVLLAVGGAVYLGASLSVGHRGGSRWPIHRSAFLVLGLAAMAATLVGPLAAQSHTDFAAHMASHLLTGMLAPLLVMLSAPMTLAFRVLPVGAARRLAWLLRSRAARFLTHPPVAATINMGSLWLVYATPLSELMMSNILLHYVLLLHFFITGYLFTVSIVSVDPAPHRASFRLRLAVMLFSIAGHSILSKHIYAYPPRGVSAASAETGGVVMFYGGDAIELILVILFFAQWYRMSSGMARRSVPATGRGTGAKVDSNRAVATDDD